METYNDIYLRVRKKLRAAGIEASEFEAKLIVANCAERTREDMLAMGKVYATDSRINERIEKSLERRLTGEPLAYVLGEWEFYSIPLKVTKDVLIPRTDTEVLAGEVINILKRKPWQTRLLDLCAGSGCVGLAVAANVSDCRVVMGDSSEQALSICRANMIKNNLSRNITVIEIDVLNSPQSLLGAFDVISCNPPYIPTGDIEKLDSSVKDFEPIEALDGGADGLKFFRAIIDNWVKRLKPGGYFAFECGIDQASALRYLMMKAGFADIQTYKDTANIERVVTGSIK